MSASQRGFTLLEILIALLIFAILSVTATMVLHSVFNSRARTQAAADRLVELQLAKSVIDQDFQQIITVLAVQGQDPVVYGKLHAISFVRDGYLNPEGQLPRSQLLHITYALSHSRLIRQTWEIPRKHITHQVILHGLSDFSIRYLDHLKHWQRTWPITSHLQSMPMAIELTIRMQHGGLWQLLYLPPSGMPAS